MVKTHPAIAVKNLSKHYPSGDSITRALKDVSLEIRNGDFLMVTGRNGSGKSTLLHLMAQLDEPTEGRIFIEGREATKLKEKRKIRLRLHSLGYIFQEYALIQDLTALENVMLPALMLSSFKDASRRARAMLEKVDLSEKMNRLPSQLSGGEQQRVAIARALINKPRIIFADEPTANLDTVSSEEVLEVFKKLNKDEGITIIMVTHEPDELAYATRIINLRDGSLSEA
jgi:putative ABC transport system ATP-binding protein